MNGVSSNGDNRLTYVCNVCMSKEFKDKAALKAHMRKFHQTATLFSQLDLEAKIRTAQLYIENYEANFDNNFSKVVIDFEAAKCQCHKYEEERSEMRFLKLHELIADHVPIWWCYNCETGVIGAYREDHALGLCDNHKKMTPKARLELEAQL